MDNFVKRVLKEEGIKDWKIVFSDGGGLCMHSKKTIYCISNDKALFLHEVAHALTPEEVKNDKTGHTAIWGDLFTELVRKYLIKQSKYSCLCNKCLQDLGLCTWCDITSKNKGKCEKCRQTFNYE